MNGVDQQAQLHEPVGDPRTPAPDDLPGGVNWSRLLPLLSVLSLAAAVFLWWALTSGFHVVAPLKFPAPGEVVDSVDALGSQLFRDAWATFLRVILSWLIGSAAGILVGLAMVRSRVLYYLVTPLVEALRPVPPIALIPFVILWFGIGESGKLFLGALGCFMVMAINTIVASGNVPPPPPSTSAPRGRSARRRTRSTGRSSSARSSLSSSAACGSAQP